MFKKTVPKKRLVEGLQGFAQAWQQHIQILQSIAQNLHAEATELSSRFGFLLLDHHGKKSPKNPWELRGL